MWNISPLLIWCFESSFDQYSSAHTDMYIHNALATPPRPTHMLSHRDTSNSSHTTAVDFQTFYTDMYTPNTLKHQIRSDASSLRSCNTRESLQFLQWRDKVLSNWPACGGSVIWGPPSTALNTGALRPCTKVHSQIQRLKFMDQTKHWRVGAPDSGGHKFGFMSPKKINFHLSHNMSICF